ncbi:MAG: redoxin domain-containing protein [Halobacteriovoraceae bacterium]|nr:redoxin domain-containing protein [Halobacteriovoraceae bacterium]
MKLLTFVFFIISSFTFAATSVGKKAPNFTLMSESHKKVSLTDFKNKIVVLEWYNKDCPFVKKHYDTNNMQNLQEKYTKQDIVWLSIVSSAKGKQGYLTPEEAMTVKKSVHSHAHHILFDTDGKVGKLYGAKTTPHMFIINKKGELAYRGAIDSVASTDKDDVKAAMNYVSKNLDNMLAGKALFAKETQSYGCSVKY